MEAAGVASSDLFWMRRALAEAGRGPRAVEPNPMVGAVVVRDGVPVGVGHHARFGGPHAEVVALAEAGDCGPGRDALRDAGALLPLRQDAPVYRGRPGRGDRARGRGDARSRSPRWRAGGSNGSARRG